MVLFFRRNTIYDLKNQYLETEWHIYWFRSLPGDFWFLLSQKILKFLSLTEEHLGVIFTCPCISCFTDICFFSRSSGLIVQFKLLSCKLIWLSLNLSVWLSKLGLIKSSLKLMKSSIAFSSFWSMTWARSISSCSHCLTHSQLKCIPIV